MSLPFNPNTPGASDIVAVTQAPIQANFQSLNTAFNNTNTGGNFTQYALQNVAAALSGAMLPVNPVGIFHAVNGANFFSGSPIPYFANSQGDFPLLPDPIINANNSGFKLGKMIINYGEASVTGTPATKVVTFAIPFTSNLTYSITVTPDTISSLSDGQWSAFPVGSSGTQCTITRGGNNNLSFFYIAIGT